MIELTPVVAPLFSGERVLIAATSISALVLVALGLTIIFGFMGVINLAHGALMMIGAYVAWSLQSAGFSPWIGILVAPVVVGIIGIIIEIGLIRYLYERPIDTLLATWGVAILLREGVKIFAGTDNKSVEAPISGSLSAVGMTFPAYWLLIILITAFIVGLTVALFKYTDIGIMALAVIENREMAAAVGINTAFSDRATFAFGAALAGFSGAIMAPILSVNAEMGIQWLADSFLVVIVGGVGTFLGTVIGGILIGGLDNIFRTIITGYTALAQALVLIVALVIIRYRPDGMVPSKGGSE